MFGGHPDNCELKCGGTAIRLTQAGHRVKFVSMTDGRCGHQQQYGVALATRRLAEAEDVRERLEIAAYEVVPVPDGMLEPSLANREAVIRRIRQSSADIVITHRPNDYHPDHRYTSNLVLDSAYLVMVPGVCPDVEPLRLNPVYLYMQDSFRRPWPFQPDIVVDIASVWRQKIHALDAHVSQFYEWLPWVAREAESVPLTAVEREAWLSRRYAAAPSVTPCEVPSDNSAGARKEPRRFARKLSSFVNMAARSGRRSSGNCSRAEPALDGIAL